jgi:ketosteroid isomerase-like protein
MSQLQTVQQIYQAFGTGDIPGIVAKLNEDVEWEHDALDHGIPWLVPGRGTAHALSFFGVVGREFDISKFEVGALMEAGQQVVAVIHIEATIRSTGKRLRDLELHLWSFDAAGRVAKFRHVVDTHQHWLASRA